MRRRVMGILIICLYCFPFAYISMQQDFVNQSMHGYLIMIIITSFLAFIGQFFSRTIFIIIGNLLSVIISVYFISEMIGNEPWGVYFKPLTPYQMLACVSILNLVPQLIAMMFAKRFIVK